MKKVFFFLIFSLIPFVGIPQNLDSLLVVAQQTQNDSAKIRMYNKIGFAYIFNDTEKALKTLKEGQSLAKSANFKFGLTELINTYGIYMDVIGKSDSAQHYFVKALDMSRQDNFRTIEVMCINNLGMFHWNRGEFDEALSYFFEALKMNDSDGNDETSHNYLSNIGLIYQEMNLNDKALTYHQRALDLRRKLNLKNEEVGSLNNIGINLKKLGRLDEAIATFENGLKLSEANNNLIGYNKILNNLANAYSLKGDYNTAISYYLKSLDQPEHFKAEETSKLHTYANLTALFNKINAPKKALLYAKEGFALIAKYPHIEGLSADLNLNVAESYYRTGEFEKARSYTQNYVRLKDSIFSEDNAKAIADLEVKYDTQKKEKQLLIQRANLAEQELTIQKKSYQFYGLLAFTVVLLFLGYLFYNQQKLRHQQLQKENELKDALIRIETQNQLQEQRLRISRDLHDNIGAQLTFIISSIDNLKYAFEINDGALNEKLNTISDFASSTIQELRDTIWAMNKSEISFEDLQTRISNYIDKAHLYDSKISFNFNVDDAVNTSKNFTSVEGMNILRIIQESIHNSLKYANASIIEVQVSKVGSKHVFKISDDGKGFDLKTVKRGNGLNNMKKRASEVDGDFVINTQPEEGTTIQFSL